ncbi:MAG: ATP-binding protein [Verrucomicrobiales bacterium]|nr:ATP-binding protein [Verrucomicrobiales bacterium]
MFTRIQTRGYRCLKAVDQELGRFRALVGPNASGKTTFLDVIGFLAELVRNRGDVIETTRARSNNFANLTWMGTGKGFELAVEATIPGDLVERLPSERRKLSTVRYEIGVSIDSDRNEIGIDHETLWAMESAPPRAPSQRDLFPSPLAGPVDLRSRPRKGRKSLLSKKPGGNDNYYPEGRESYTPSFKLGRGRAALANIPADSESFPVSTWFKNLLETGVQPFVLDSRLMRRPSPPGLGLRFNPDGSNLPWVVELLRKEPNQFQRWLDHVRTALPDVRDVESVEREEDKHRYLALVYATGARVPSWLASDGTLRLLALTIPAYLSELDGTFLIEEPENGIHPSALEPVLQSLSSIYRGQVLVATHSPVALSMIERADILCFAKDDQGATDIVSGDRHPVLRDWQNGHPDLGVLFATGILG